MIMAPDFIIQKPHNSLLSTLVDYYFFIDVPVDALALEQEYIIPFPRITFGYFFDHPFLVINHTLHQSAIVEMAISRISTHQITVQPQSDSVKILGAHVRPYTLAYLTEKPIATLPWLINTMDLFQEKAVSFKDRINQCQEPQQMFEEVERIFLDSLLARDLATITQAVNIMEAHAGDIQFKEVAEQVGVSERTLRNQFNRHIGCSPKDYMHLVKLKSSVYQMRYSDASLTGITYDNHYFDQAHFIHSIRQITGRSPKTLRKEMPGFRFLQF